ncbi:hypothetical protein BDR07DRAFT_1607451 [Suillus spraguei]|nr:hypothetical protein BDR07DRAFT_1607451 [Suillus spraguei]
MNNSTSDTRTDGPSNNVLDSALETTLAHLNTLTGSTEEEDIMKILERLDSANGVAKDVEGKLDGILGTLDDLLTSLSKTYAEASIAEETISTETERVTVSSTESKTTDGPALSR